MSSFTSMAPIAEGQQRPAMRRKSSAQNLLASFKSSGSAAGGPPPSSFPAAAVPASNGLSYSAAPTPTTATMPPREWDVQSLQSDGVGASSIQTNGTSVEFLRELVKKRIITLTYLRNVHEGCVVSRHRHAHRTNGRRGRQDEVIGSTRS